MLSAQKKKMYLILVYATDNNMLAVKEQYMLHTCRHQISERVKSAEKVVNEFTIHIHVEAD